MKKEATITAILIQVNLEINEYKIAKKNLHGRWLDMVCSWKRMEINPSKESYRVIKG